MKFPFLCLSILIALAACSSGCVTLPGEPAAAPSPPAGGPAAPSLTTAVTPAAGTAAPGTAAIAPARPAGPALEFSGPVSVTLNAENAVSVVAYGLRVPPGGSPVDMAGCTYAVTTRDGHWSVDESSPDLATAYTVVRQRNTLLEDGELLKVDLDTGALETGGSAFTIGVKPAAGTPLYRTCTVPAGMAGGVFEC
jgi:hypothetical protein